MIDWLVGYALSKRLVVAMICIFVCILATIPGPSWRSKPIPTLPMSTPRSSRRLPGWRRRRWSSKSPFRWNASSTAPPGS